MTIKERKVFLGRLKRSDLFKNKEVLVDVLDKALLEYHGEDWARTTELPGKTMKNIADRPHTKYDMLCEIESLLGDMLHETARKIRNFGTSGRELNAKDEKGCTPLTYAVRSCNYLLVEKMLRMGADPNIMSPTGLSPLKFAMVIAELTDPKSPPVLRLEVTGFAKIAKLLKENKANME